MPARERQPKSTPLLVSGDYAYMTEGYYACQDAELEGRHAMPTCADALDAYVVPIALEKAAAAGVAVPKWVLTNEYFPTPAICYGVNPFSRKYAVVRDEASRESEARRLTWNHKYTMCCQSIAATTEIVEFRMVCGRTQQTEFADWATRLFDVFRVPLATVRLLRTSDDPKTVRARTVPKTVQFSAMEPLPFGKLTPTERAWAEESARG